MRNIFICLIIIFLISGSSDFVYSQANSNAANLIIASDLESNVAFLASPLLKGRMNGEAGLELAALYIASQAKLYGLKPANGNSYFQPFSIMKKIRDPNSPPMQFILNKKDTIILDEPRYQLVPTDPAFKLPKDFVEKVINNVAGFI